MMRRVAILLALVLMAPPLGAQGADLVVWWVKGFYPKEDQALQEIITEFERDRGKRVELVQPRYNEMFEKLHPAPRQDSRRISCSRFT